MASVVVLTRDFGYWGERSLRDTIRLYVKGKIQILSADESKVIRAGISRDGITFKMPAPLVVRLLKFAGYKIKKEGIEYSDQAVYNRDDYYCQYWHYDEKGTKFKFKCDNNNKSIDHIVPRSRGGLTSFENCVTCCKWHNSIIKKNKTLTESGLKLIDTPKAPTYKKGDVVISLKFNLNLKNKAHRSYSELMNVR